MRFIIDDLEANTVILSKRLDGCSASERQSLVEQKKCAIKTIDESLTELNKKLSWGYTLSTFERSQIIDIAYKLRYWVNSNISNVSDLTSRMIAEKLNRLVYWMDNPSKFVPLGRITGLFNK